MAGNKFDTQFAIHKPDAYYVTWYDQNSVPTTWEGSAEQIINNILKQQLK